MLRCYTLPLVAGATVQFDPVTYRVVEGMAANLRLVLSQAVSSEVTVQINSQDVSTSGNAAKLAGPSE